MCKKPLFSDFNIDTAKFNFPSNCGIGVFNVDSVLDASDSNKTTADRTKMAVFCGACLPGYKPTYAKDGNGDDIDIMVVACTAIANCEESDAFNSCSKCKDTYSFKYDDGVVNFQECV